MLMRRWGHCEIDGNQSLGNVNIDVWRELCCRDCNTHTHTETENEVAMCGQLWVQTESIAFAQDSRPYN